MKELEKLKVGDYIRTKNGLIGKLEEINKEPTDETITYIVTDTFVGMIEEIVKHSQNIIDLIEIGDYVNGRLVLQVDYKNKNVCLLIPLTDTLANTNIMWYGYEDIKAVVTHEQMSNIEYRLED